MACPSFAQRLSLEPVGNPVLTESSGIADLNGDGRDELIAFWGTHAYVHVLRGAELEMVAQMSFDRTKVLRWAGAADMDGVPGDEFAVTLLDPDTLSTFLYAFDGTKLASRGKLVVTRAAVGGRLDLRGPSPWDGIANILGSVVDPTAGRVLLVAYCAGFSCQPRGVIGFHGTPPYSIAWERLVGPCVEIPYWTDCRADPAETRLVLAGRGYCNGAEGSGMTDSISAMIVVDGLGEIRWSRQVAPARSQLYYSVVDLDGDGRLEIAVTGRHQEEMADVPPMLSVLALEDGRVLCERVMEANVIGLRTADLNGDGRREILLICEDGLLRIYDSALDPVNSLKTQATIPPLFLVEDLTGDGRPEIVVSSRLGRDLDIFDHRLRRVGHLVTGVQRVYDIKSMRVSETERLLAVSMPDELRLFRVTRLRGRALLVSLFDSETGRRVAPPLGLGVALAALGGLMIVQSRRMLRGAAAQDRVRGIVSDLKIIRHGVRAEGEKPEPLVRLRRGLRTCAEPGGLPAGLAILRDAQPNYRSYVQPTLKRIHSATMLALPGRLALALEFALGRASRDLDRLFGRMSRAEQDAPRFVLLCAHAERSLRALEELLRRIEAAALSRAPADPLAEANAACDALRPVMKQRGVVLDGIQVTGEPGARAFIEAAELRRVLHDLLLNAVEACQDANEPRVGIAIACGERRVSLRVTDNGRGVPAEDWEGIFHGKSTKTPPGGEGLNHARQTIEAHSGRVRVRESIPWERTEFEVELCRIPS